MSHVSMIQSPRIGSLNFGYGVSREILRLRGGNVRVPLRFRPTRKGKTFAIRGSIQHSQISARTPGAALRHCARDDCTLCAVVRCTKVAATCVRTYVRKVESISGGYFFLSVVVRGKSRQQQQQQQHLHICIPLCMLARERSVKGKGPASLLLFHAGERNRIFRYEMYAMHASATHICMRACEIIKSRMR